MLFTVCSKECTFTWLMLGRVGRFETEILGSFSWVSVQVLDKILRLKTVELSVLHVISLHYLSRFVIVLPRLLRNSFRQLFLPLVCFLETYFVVN